MTAGSGPKKESNTNCKIPQDASARQRSPLNRRSEFERFSTYDYGGGNDVKRR